MLTSIIPETNEGGWLYKKKKKKKTVGILARGIPSQPHLHRYQILSKTLKWHRDYLAHLILP